MTDAYLPHLSDPFRRTIAVRYVQHELRKLFPTVRDADVLNALDGEVGRWFDGNPTFAPVRDFWNGVHGISMGFRLKHIVPWVTSLHLQWNEADVPVDALSFGSTLEEVRVVGDRPLVPHVRSWYFDVLHRTALDEVRRAHEERSAQSAPRDAFPLFVIEREGILRVHDGNRRLLRAIIFEQPTIRAVTGRPNGEPALFEHWVPTSLLLDLVTLYRSRLTAGDAGATQYIAGTIARLIRHSRAGVHEFTVRCLHTLREHVDADNALNAAVNAELRML